LLGQYLGRAIDRWDEVAARVEDGNKTVVPCTLDASLAFPGLPATADVAALADAAQKVVAAPEDYYGLSGPDNIKKAVYESSWLSFPSLIQTEVPENNTVFARVFESKHGSDVVLLVPHWNSGPESLFSFGKYLNWMGYTAIVLILPYHHQRRRPDSRIADYFVSANLGRTIRSVRQSVLDLRAIIDWLELRGHRRFYVMGASLGSCVAGLASAFDHRIRACNLLLTAGKFADVVWTGRATRHISAALQRALSLQALRAIWSVISLDSFAQYYASNGQHLLVVSGNRDKVVLPQLTEEFVEKLRNARVSVQHVRLSCGHYSMAMLPFNVRAAIELVTFLRRERAAPELGHLAAEPQHGVPGHDP
jgi:hypothetical protein